MDDKLTGGMHSVSSIGPFSWRWPDGVEHFHHGWNAEVRISRHRLAIRHGLSRRQLFGRSRVCSATWVSGRPTVEGVEADDYEMSQALLNRIKVEKQNVRPGESVPAGYEELNIVSHREEIDAPYSPYYLAVKIAQDDIES